MKENTNVSRRSFLKSSGAAAAALGLLQTSESIVAKQSAVPFAPSPLNKWPGRVVVNFNKFARVNSTYNEAVVRKMVDDSIKLLTDQTDLGAAWKAIFPNTLTENSKIAIKINVLNSDQVVSTPFAVSQIIEGLKKMQFGTKTFPETNIIIYDGNNGNISGNTSSASSGIYKAGFTNTLFPNIKFVNTAITNHSDGAYGNKNYADELYKADFLINIPSLRGHSSTYGSVTLGFKSHFGTYPANFGHASANASVTFLRDINCTGPVFNKTVLTVNTAILGKTLGNGPGGAREDYKKYPKTIDPTATTTVDPCTIIMSTDSVSAEYQAIKIMKIEGNGTTSQSYSIDSMPSYLKASAGIDVTGITPTYNIGILDETKQEVRKILNGNIIPTATRNSSPILRNREGLTIQLLQNNSLYGEITVDPFYVGKTAKLHIVNAMGETVWKDSFAILGTSTSFSWDLRSLQGSRVGRGAYIAKISYARKANQSQFVIK